jgi:hypothetical protein
VNAWLERQLGGRQWFNGPAFGWGDLAVVPFVHGAATTGNPPAAGTRLAGWLERARARPSVATAFEAAAASMQGVEMIPQLIASGIFKREYRVHRLEWMMRSGAASRDRRDAPRHPLRRRARVTSEAAVAAACLIEYCRQGVASGPASCYRPVKSNQRRRPFRPRSS